MNFLYRWAQFMRGRRGWDQLCFFLMISSFIIEILGRILRNGIVYYVGLALFIYAIFRMMSRNIPKREAENQKYLQIQIPADFLFFCKIKCRSFHGPDLSGRNTVSPNRRK